MAGKRHSIVYELLNASSSTGASTGISSDDANNGVMSVVGYDQVAVQLAGGGSTYAATVNFQVTVDGSNWLNAVAMNKEDGILSDSVSNDSGIHVVPVTGMSGFRLNISAYTDGNVTGIARATVGGGNLSFADIQIDSATFTGADSDVAIFGADTGGTPVALGADTASPQGPALYTSPAPQGIDFVAADGINNTVSMPVNSTGGALWHPNIGFIFNGTTWDRMRGDTAARLQVSETWNSTLQVEETTAVQDKTFAVTADEDWHVMWAWVEYTSNATAGNRQVVMQVRDSADDVIMELVPGVTQAASLTYKYLFAPGMSDLTAVRDTDYIMTPMPPTLILPELFDIRIFDRAVITGGDTANEEAIVQMMVQNRARVST